MDYFLILLIGIWIGAMSAFIVAKSFTENNTKGHSHIKKN